MSSISCSHNESILIPSPYARSAGYVRASPSALLAAIQSSGRVPTRSAQAGVGGGKRHGQPSPIDPGIALPSPSTYPAPLVLPGDDLADDPKQPAQSLRSWLRLKERNPVTNERRKIYVVAPPDVDPSVSDVQTWPIPTHLDPKSPAANAWLNDHPQTDAIMSYIRSFYTGLPVKSLNAALKFTRWEDNPHSYLGLECPTISELIGIRHRADPTKTFPCQVNLNDLLDAAIELLPDDAYCLLMLIPYDLYEDDSDDFCCGRAYGGSRIAVVSSARYNPGLDAVQGAWEGREVDEAHAWPLSHCAAYVRSLFINSMSKGRAKVPEVESSPTDSSTPLGAAMRAAATAVPDTASTYLLRVCRTATHELGHCFGLGHCVYYACFMQSTGSIAEDVRQPPYACPVCLEKIERATGSSEVEHLKALVEVCAGQGGAGWVGLGTWAARRIESLDEGGGSG